MEINYTQAIQAINKGHRVARLQWGMHHWIEKVTTVATSRVPELKSATVNWIVKKDEKDIMKPWTVSQEDLVAKDYVVIK